MEEWPERRYDAGKETGPLLEPPEKNDAPATC